MIHDSPADETVEISSDRWIGLAFAREWPHFVVDWSVRQRAGESDFPVSSGRVSRAPGSGRSADEIWNEVRDAAIEEAHASLAQNAGTATTVKQGLLARLFKRQG